MLYRITFSLLVVTMLLGCSAQAQQTQNDPGTITINMSASELLPADQIVFNINVNAEANSPQGAFELHQEQEALLAGLLKEFDIQEENIHFQPVRINRSTNNLREQVVRTSQQVSVTFSDFDIYEHIQLKLIENGFDSFNGSFSSSEMEEGKQKALTSAINAAKEKAMHIANASGVQLGTIRQINYSETQVNPYSSGLNEMVITSRAGSMMDFSQTVEVTASISISFLIAE